MAGLLGYALAGGLTGYGNSLVEDAKAKREAAMEELRNSRLMEREDRQFDRQTQRDDTQWERQQQRDDTQFERGTATSGKPVRIGDRDRLLRQDGSLGDIMDGNEVFTGQISTGQNSSDPVDIRAARILVEEGVFPDFKTAWSDVNAAKSDKAARARLVTDFYKVMLEDFADERSNAEKFQSAQERIDELMGGPASASSRAQSPDAATQSTQQPDAPPTSAQGSEGGDDKPPPGYPDAKKAPDGQWYVQKDGKWHRIVAQ